MSLSETQKNKIIVLLEKKIEEKLKNYTRETTSMPFLLRLVQDSKKVASYSFMHSINTTLGMSIYAEVSKIIALESASECEVNRDLGGKLSIEQKSIIADIIRKLRNKETTVNHDEEVKLVLNASSTDGKEQKEGRVADFFMLRDDMEHLFEIKTVKANMDVFTKSKEKLLEWVARRRKIVKVFLALPYNPYHPDPYKRFTEQGVLERKKEFLVGKEYWDFLGGDNTFEDLLELFDVVGKRFKSAIQGKIDEVARKRMSN